MPDESSNFSTPSLIGSSDDASLPPPENRIYYPALDGLRACAAIMVFLQHYFLYRRSAHFHWGWTGVDIFFVLSGFLITGILFDTRNSPDRVRVFYLRRTLRIFPLYYGVFLFLLLLTPVFHWAWSRYWLLWLVYIGNYGHLLASNVPLASLGSLEQLHSSFSGLTLSFGHFWSLCVEEQFYLVWPFVVFTIRKRTRLLALCISVVVLMPFARLAALFFLPPRWIAADILYFATPFRIDALLLGSLIALLLRGPKADLLLRSARLLLVASLLLFAAAWAGSAIFLHQGFGAEPDLPWIKTFGFTLIDLIAAGILLLTLQPGTLFFRLFSLKPLRRLGKVSYGFYIFHDMLHAPYHRLAALLSMGHTAYVPAIAPVLAFVCTVVLANLSFRYFESPFLRMKDRLTT